MNILVQLFNDQFILGLRNNWKDLKDVLILNLPSYRLVKTSSNLMIRYSVNNISLYMPIKVCNADYLDLACYTTIIEKPLDYREALTIDLNHENTIIDSKLLLPKGRNLFYTTIKDVVEDLLTNDEKGILQSQA
ncbi:hypothetical protein AR9_g285 [Bacillus phage AR9]|uniref:Uncharacterized protein n=2 Tax=Bacillus phage PBS1 TaxID=10683 RepID=A0A172JIJ2_BPPB1|nr:hypothetical protein BI022_gp284 [Bacillus phage AR9]YP_009664379.1 hypothetical protein FK780_gp269 [Bacillus phage PBS1]PTU25728.1 hypothetical protein DA469_22265 [Bacillus subtilis]WCS68413.1 hypothetical protein Goe21_03040 [Bacillus phage vB_BsuM-Goe21]AMS01369.1 hypothetical protein AR9_g285 [Bacillus phage AR9]AST99999.1 hypothetical protein PBI_PBS1_178 [Bacillus phage PBS1]BDE75486.1 hypothetical protein [Bacillus phage PBS1]